MSATVIDALVVTLGLDASNWRRGKDQAKQDLSDVKTRAGEATANVRTLARAALELFAVFTAGRAIKDFVRDVTESNAQLERLSLNTNTNVRELQSWGQVVTRSGGTAQGFQGTLLGLSRQMTEIAVTGQSAVLPYFRALGVHLGDAQGHARPLLDIILDTADRLSAMPDRQLANNLGLMMGFDQGTLNAMLQGRQEMERMIARQRELNPLTEESARASLRLSQAWYDVKQASEGVGRTLLVAVTPALERFLLWVRNGLSWLREHRMILLGLAAAVGVVLAPALWAAAVAAWTLLAPLLLMAAPVLAVGAALALLADDWDVWRKGGKAALGDTWQYWNDLWDQVAGSGPQVQGALRKALGFVYDFMHSLWSGDAMDSDSIWKNIGEGLNLLKQGGASSQGSRDDAMAELQKEGYTWEQAAGITSALSAESRLNPSNTNPDSGAYGIGQWLGARKSGLFAFAKGRGLDPNALMTQLLYRREEETPGSPYADPGALKARAAISGTGDASTASTSYLEMNERPGPGMAGDLDRARSELWLLRMAQRPAGAGGGSSRVDQSRSSEVNVGELHVHTQATDAHGMARGARAALRDQLADQADSGLW